MRDRALLFLAGIGIGLAVSGYKIMETRSLLRSANETTRQSLDAFKEAEATFERCFIALKKAYGEGG